MAYAAALLTGLDGVTPVDLNAAGSPAFVRELPLSLAPSGGSRVFYTNGVYQSVTALRAAAVAALVAADATAFLPVSFSENAAPAPLVPTVTLNAGATPASVVALPLELLAAGVTNACRVGYDGGVYVDVQGTLGAVSAAIQAASGPGGGNVTAVTATAPIVSTGGAAPNISITPANGGAAGSMSAADFSKLAALPADAQSASQVATSIANALATLARIVLTWKLIDTVSSPVATETRCYAQAGTSSVSLVENVFTVTTRRLLKTCTYQLSSTTLTVNCTLTLFKSGVATAQTLVVAPGTLGPVTVTTDVVFAAGDTFQWQSTHGPGGVAGQFVIADVWMEWATVTPP